MAKVNALTPTGLKVQKTLDLAKKELGLLPKDNWQVLTVLEYLIDAVETTLLSPDPLWEKIDQ